jgi:protein TonB
MHTFSPSTEKCAKVRRIVTRSIFSKRPIAGGSMKLRVVFSAIGSRSYQHRGQLLSILAHTSLLFLLATAVQHAPKIAPFRIPGTRAGITILTWYSPGSQRSSTSNIQTPKVENVPKLTAPHQKPTANEIQKAPAPQSQQGIGTSPQSGLGDGDITIALETYFPYPKPDLSTLPRGTEGDVILDAVVDEQGKISQLTLLKGLGPAIDQAVIATVQQWSYTPAKRNGIPVPSEREIHFHYQRS